MKVETLSIGELQDAYASGTLTVRQAALDYLRRIAELDRGDGGLNAVLEINPDALSIADAFDARLRAGEAPAGLFGVPVLVKDNINTGDKMVTSAGSVALADHFAAEDAGVIARLRAAGALILGKANMTEFANYMTDGQMPSGYSSRGGQVINPFNAEKTPSGSSSGSAVAVAAGLCAAAVGTETSGSIMHPAWMNGVVGVKPTVGLVSRSGILPISWTCDTPGPMARTVRDAAILLGAMAGYDERDAATHAQKGCSALDYASVLDKDALRGMTIGISNTPEEEPYKAFWPNEEELRAFDRLLGVLRDCGAVIVPAADHLMMKQMLPVCQYEFRRGVDAYLAASRGRTAMRSLEDIVAYNRRHAYIALRYGQGNLERSVNETSGTAAEKEYLQALAAREAAVEQMDASFGSSGADVILCRTFGNAAPFTGFPCMSIPIGQCGNGVPIGSYWIARRYGEAALLRAAYAAEQALGLCLRPLR